MDSVVLCFTIILALFVLIAVGEAVSGKLMSFTLSSVLARRRDIPNAFTRLVVFKLGIYVSGLVLGPSVLMFLVYAYGHGGLNRSYALIVMLFLVWPMTLFALKFKSIVKLEKQKARSFTSPSERKNKRMKSR